MKRREETAIMLAALTAAGVQESASVRAAIEYGLKLIRMKKFEERTNRNRKENT